MKAIIEKTEANKREYNSERRRKLTSPMPGSILDVKIRENITPRGDGNYLNSSYPFNIFRNIIRENITPRGDGNPSGALSISD